MAVQKASSLLRSNSSLIEADLNVLDESREEMKFVLRDYLKSYAGSTDAMHVMLFLEPLIQQHLIMDKTFLTHVMDEQFLQDVNDVLDRLKKLSVMQDDEFVMEMTADAARQIVDYIISACKTAKMCLESEETMRTCDPVYKNSLSIRQLLGAGLLDPDLFDDEGKKEV